MNTTRQAQITAVLKVGTGLTEAADGLETILSGLRYPAHEAAAAEAYAENEQRTLTGRVKRLFNRHDISGYHLLTTSSWHVRLYRSFVHLIYEAKRKQYRIDRLERALREKEAQIRHFALDRQGY